MASTYPAALDNFDDVPATLAELPKHSTNHNAERAAINALQAAVGTTEASRLVQRFASKAALDAAIPAPEVGTTVAVAGRLCTYRAGGWWMQEQGQLTGTPNADGDLTINYGVSLSNIVVVATPRLLSGQQVTCHFPAAPTSTSQTVRITMNDNPFNTTSLTVNWIVVGTLA